jgi:hypothetical protein
MAVTVIGIVIEYGLATAMPVLIVAGDRKREDTGVA